MWGPASDAVSGGHKFLDFLLQHEGNVQAVHQRRWHQVSHHLQTPLLEAEHWNTVSMGEWSIMHYDGMCVCVCARVRACMRERVRQCMCVCVYIQVKLLFWFVLDIGLYFTNWTINYKCVCMSVCMCVHACMHMFVHMCVVIAGAEWCILVYTYVSSCVSVLLFAYVCLLTTFQDTSLVTQLGQ